MPSAYYCHRCAVKRDYLNPPPTDPLATKFQLDAHRKHTTPGPGYPVQSVFTMLSTQAYDRYIVTTLAAGAVEVDEKGRVNVIWVAGKTVGFQFNLGQLVTPPQDAVKVVRPSDTGKVHAYPAHSTTFTGAKCVDCR
jgi:hypothetical protein